MHVFVSGGCKNGKSFYAQRIAKAMGTPLYYIATMIPHDDEDLARIARHLRERDGWGFETVECGKDLPSALLNADPNGSFLLDSVTALLSNVMFDEAGFHPDAAEALASDLSQVLARCKNIVLVSDYLYSDAMVYDAWTLAYRKALATLDRMLAKNCDTVLEVCAGCVTTWKGGVTV